MMRKTSIVLSILCIIGMLAGCKTAKDPASAGTHKVEQTTTQTQKTTTTTKPQFDVNYLTGEKDIVVGQEQRPVGIMVGNNAKSRPQYGLNKADMLVEAETEGGITRIMALFSNADRIPKIGPVRSARTPFVTIATTMGAVYCHAGGSVAALKAIKNNTIANINALVYDGGMENKNNNTFWRDRTLFNQKGQEYSMLTKGENVAYRMKKMGYRTTATKTAPFTFGDSGFAGAGNQLQCKMSWTDTVNFRYNSNTGKYTKYLGTLAENTAHKLADGGKIEVRNVLVIYADRYNENNTTINFTLNTGSGVALTGGKSSPMKWTFGSQGLSFKQDNGAALQLTPGKTYICIVSKANSSATVIK